MTSARLLAVGMTVAMTAACTPVTNSFEVHTGELGCEEANRFVYQSIVDMGMEVTAFRAAKPGSPGLVRAKGSDRSGSVTITCRPDGVDIDPAQGGIGADMAFERGVFLGVTGRSGLTIDGGVITGRQPQPGTVVADSDSPAKSASLPVSSRSAGTGVHVTVVPQQGFSTVLDFDADLSSAGILPILLSFDNASARTYGLEVSRFLLRVRGSRQTAAALTVDEAIARLRSVTAASQDPGAVGDIASAAGIMRNRALAGGRLAPGARLSGYLYYPTGDYDRAKLTLLDVALGEYEGFLVEF